MDGFSKVWKYILSIFILQGIDYAGWAKTGLAGWGLTKRWENYLSTWTGIPCFFYFLYNWLQAGVKPRKMGLSNLPTNWWKSTLQLLSTITAKRRWHILVYLSLSCAQVCHVNIGPIGFQNCVITDTKICAGGVPDRGPCRGDSGGALVAQDNDLQGWSAVGLVSYQPGNILEWPECGSDKFTVFTEVSKWVQNPDEKSLFEKERREALWTNQCALWRYVFFRYLGWIANQFNLDPPLS